MRKISVMLLAGVAFGSVPAMAQEANTPAAVDSDDAEIVVFGNNYQYEFYDIVCVRPYCNTTLGSASVRVP
jgi:hypothetical protein